MGISIGIGIGIGQGKGGGGGPAPTERLAAHAIVVDFGDGLHHKGTTKGLSNPLDRALMASSAVFRQLEGGNQAISGDNMDDHQTIRQGYTDALNPSVLLSSMGHNPPYTLSKGGGETQQQFVDRFIARWGADLIANRFVANADLRYVIGTTPPSNIAESDAAAIWAAQEAFIDDLIADGKSAYKVAWQAGFNTATMYWDGVHFNEKGGDYTGPLIAAHLDQIGTIMTADEVLDQVAAIPDAGIGANLETNHSLVSSGFSATLAFTVNPANGDTVTINGATCTFVTSGAAGANQCNIGAAATNTATNLRTLLNANLATYGLSAATLVQSVAAVRLDAALALTLARSAAQPLFANGRMATGWAVCNFCTGIDAVSCDVVSGEQSAAITGVPSAEGTVTWNRLTNLAHTGQPYGARNEWMGGLRIDDGAGGNTDGLKTFGATQGGGNQGVWLNGGAADANVGNWNGQFDGFWRTVPKYIQALALNYTMAFTARLSTTVSNSARTIRLRFRKPTERQVDTKAFARPIYLGDDWVQGGATSNPHVPTNQSAQMGPIAVPANGGSITARPGIVQGGNVTFAPAWYKNVPSDLAADLLPEEHPTTPVSPFATAFASGTFAGLVSGDKLRFYSRPTNDFLGAGTRPLLQPYIEYTVA
jgi:hypothetical protein